MSDRVEQRPTPKEQPSDGMLKLAFEAYPNTPPTTANRPERSLPKEAESPARSLPEGSLPGAAIKDGFITFGPVEGQAKDNGNGSRTEKSRDGAVFEKEIGSDGKTKTERSTRPDDSWSTRFYKPDGSGHEVGVDQLGKNFLYRLDENGRRSSEIKVPSDIQKSPEFKGLKELDENKPYGRGFERVRQYLEKEISKFLSEPS